MTLVKICGLREPNHALAAAAAGAHFIGIMFAESRRKVTPQQCFDVCEAIRGIESRTAPPVQFEAPVRGEVRGLGWFGAWSEAIETALWRWRPLIVGVFADQPSEEVNEVAEAAGLDLVQLSGGESAEYIRRIERPVIRAIHIPEQFTTDDLFDSVAESLTAAVMLDKASGSARGGTGQTFDWEVAAEASPRLPFFLAGGLTVENVAEAIARVQPWAVDVSTGVETNGVKDPEKIRAFIKATLTKDEGRGTRD